MVLDGFIGVYISEGSSNIFADKPRLSINCDRADFAKFLVFK